jgi:hypothetical protein
MCQNIANFRIDGCDDDGNDVSIIDQEKPRDVQKQIYAGIRHMEVMSSYINKEDGSNTKPAQLARKQSVEVLKMLNGYSGYNKVTDIFKLQKTNGIGSMMRFFGSDILHTWVLGFVEQSVAFTLQIIKYIGHSNVDSTYNQSPKKLVELIKEFPAHNSLHPTKKHVRYPDIFDLLISTTSKKATNPRNTTGLAKMRESGKLPPALLQIYFALAQDDLLPDRLTWSRNQGFSAPHFAPRQVVINALNAVLEVHWYLKAESLTETQLSTLQMLISNAQAQMLVLDVMRKRILHKALTAKPMYEDIRVDEISLFTNIKFEALTHLVEAKKQNGCDNNCRDTEHGESMMKMCKVLFADTNMRYFTVLKDMLKKYLHLEYLCIAKKGLEHANVCCSIEQDESKKHTKASLIASNDVREFKVSKAYTRQDIVFSDNAGLYVTKVNGANWHVHPTLKVVSLYLFFSFFKFYYKSTCSGIYMVYLHYVILFIYRAVRIRSIQI